MNVDFIPQSLRDLRQEFVARGFDLRVVGGAVRDTLAGNPIKDIDLCTDADPDQQVLMYTELDLRFIPTGIDHGTVSVVLDGEVHEITSLRVDVETNGRHALVQFTTNWYMDLARRDLTINAMALTFDGELIDPFGGEQDLKNGVVRFVGNANDRIQEDYLRILRWFRFLGRYGDLSNPDIQTRNAIRDNALGLKSISRERVWSEIRHIIAHPCGVELTSLMVTLGPAFYIGLPAGHPRSLVTAKSVTSNPELLVAAWLNWNYRDIKAIAVLWKWSRAEIDHALWMCDNIYEGRDLRRLLVIENIKQPWVAELAALEERDDWEQNALANWVFPPFPVSGNDLIEMGIKPGMTLGVILRNLKEHWFVTGCCESREELLAIITTV